LALIPRQEAALTDPGMVSGPQASIWSFLLQALFVSMLASRHAREDPILGIEVHLAPFDARASHAIRNFA
jgi:hypothetical protein